MIPIHVLSLNFPRSLIFGPLRWSSLRTSFPFSRCWNRWWKSLKGISRSDLNILYETYVRKMLHHMTEMTFKYIQPLREMPSKVLDSQYHRESCKVWCSYWPSSSLHGDDSAWCSFRWNPGNPRWCRANWTLHTSHCWTCMWAKYAVQIWLESRHICWFFFELHVT